MGQGVEERIHRDAWGEGEIALQQKEPSGEGPQAWISAPPHPSASAEEWAALGPTCTLLPFRCILRIMLPWVVTSVQ